MTFHFYPHSFINLIWNDISAAQQNNPTYEFFPSRGGPPQQLNFLTTTLPANLYPLTWLLPSGRLFMQANWGTAILDPGSGNQTTLANIPKWVGFSSEMKCCLNETTRYVTRWFSLMKNNLAVPSERTPLVEQRSSSHSHLLPTIPLPSSCAVDKISIIGHFHLDSWIKLRAWIVWGLHRMRVAGGVKMGACRRGGLWGILFFCLMGRYFWRMVLSRVRFSFFIFLMGGSPLFVFLFVGASGYGKASYLVGNSFAKSPILTPV